MLKRLSLVLADARARTRLERLYWAAVILVYGFGIWVRSTRFWVDPIALWGDEALWASRMLSQPLLTPSFRPLGFMATCAALVDAFGVDERVLRLPPYLAALASLPLFHRVGSAMLGIRNNPPGPRHVILILMLAVAATHPMLVDFAKEFKPYSVELFVHLLLLDRLLVFRRTNKTRDLVALLLLSPLGFFFAYNAIFVFPVIFGLLGWWALRARAWRRLAACLASAIAALLAIGGLYLIVFSQIPNGEDDSAFWGKKYGVFYIDDGRANQVQWQIDKYEELAAMPGAGREFWQLPGFMSERVGRELAALERLSWVLAYVVGAVVLLRRRRFEDAVMLLGPVLTVLLFNVLSLWPWGSFRTNLFLMAYVLPVPFVGFSYMLSMGRRWLVPVASVVALLHVAPNLAFGFGVHREKRSWTGHSEVPKILELMRADREAALVRNPSAPKSLVLLDAYTCEVYKFYLLHHDAVKTRHAEFYRNNFGWRCIQRIGYTVKAVQARRGLPTWVIVSKRTLVGPTFDAVSQVGNVVVNEHPSYNHLVVKLEGRRQ